MTQTVIDYIVQNHPSRQALGLLQILPTARLITDHGGDPPSPWRGYKLCLEAINRDSSHACIIQDDALPCRNFALAVEQIAQANPSTPVVLFLADMPRRTSRDALRASKDDRRYVPLHFYDFCPVVAMLWPRAKAQEFSVWARDAKLPGQPNPRSDDAAVGYWMRTTRQTILATVPSLVDHDSSQPSVKGTQNASSSFRALLLAEDGLSYEW